MKIILPKTSPLINRKLPFFFLAGPVLGGGGWQTEMCLALQKEVRDKLNFLDFYVAVPCRWESNAELSRFFLNIPTTFKSQTVWERRTMKESAQGNNGCLIFWLACESKTEPRTGEKPYACDTRGEIGEWRTRKAYEGEKVKLVIGADPNFPGLHVIKRNFNDQFNHDYHFPETIRDTAQEAVKKVTRQS